ncbi:MAG: UDP-N-acetylmuramoyl-tripeptide--D-alanyl-D-alanine ligase [Acidimicrobiia bacterium]
MTYPHPTLGWTLDRIAEGVGGVLVGDGGVVVDRVATDSRGELAGALFVAISGEQFDGHTFASAAVAGGASAAVVSRSKGSDAVPRIEVDDTGDALLALAAMRRDELTMPVVAITGSTGKTSTKDLVASGIPGAWASPRSYNNEVGVPLTVLSTPSDASVLVLEVGSRGSGHITWLAPAIKPDVAVITNLGVVHLETFGSEEGLALAKSELVALLSEDGVYVVPNDESRIRGRSGAKQITFGSSGADVAVRSVGLDHLGRASITLDADDRSFAVDLAMSGEHQALNAAAAVGVAVALGLDLGAFIAGMATATGSAWRMDVHEGQFTVVNDAYNANPQSVEAALRTVAAMAGNQKVAVLGPMAELGVVCEQEHARIGVLAHTLGFAAVVVVGADHGYARDASAIIANATDLGVAADTLLSIVQPGDVVLVKASRSAGLEALAFDLVKEAST